MMVMTTIMFTMMTIIKMMQTWADQTKRMNQTVKVTQR